MTRRAILGIRNRLAPMPPPLRFRPSGATLDNMIYVVGGGSIAEDCSEVALTQSKLTIPRGTGGQSQATLASRPGFKLGSAWIA